MRRALAVLVALVALVAGSVSMASASHISAAAGSQTWMAKESKCAQAAFTATVAGSPTSNRYSAVRVGNVPAPCQGLSVLVNVHGTAGALLATGSGTLNGPSATIGTGAYDAAAVQKVVVKVRGWLWLATWTAPAPQGPATCVALSASGAPTGQSCSVAVTNVTTWGTVGDRFMHTTLKVTTSAPNFSVTVNFASTPTYPGWTPKSVRSNGNPLKQPGYSCTELPIVRGLANTGWGDGTKTLYLEAREVAQAYSGPYSFCS